MRQISGVNITPKTSRCWFCAETIVQPRVFKPVIAQAARGQVNVPQHGVGERHVHRVRRPVEIALLLRQFIQREERLERRPGAFLVLAIGVERAAPIRLGHVEVPLRVVLARLDRRALEVVVAEQLDSPCTAAR